MNRKLRKEYCGLFSCRPQWLQKFATAFYFTLFSCLIILVQGMYLGYAIGVLTTVEKRFKVTSFKSGTLLSTYDIGHAISVLMIGHFGPWLHKPIFIGLGAWLSGLACFGLASPNFLFGPYDDGYYDHLKEGDRENSHLCLAGSNSPSTINTTLTSSFDTLITADRNSSLNWWAFYLLVVFQFICGISSSPFTTLAYVYIDDNTPQKHSLVYFGLLTAMWGFGPAFGFGLAAVCSQQFVTLTDAPAGIKSSSPSWIGAWWLGFVILGFLYLLSGLAFFFYPKKLKKDTRLSLSTDLQADNSAATAKDAVELDAFLAYGKERHSIISLGESSEGIFTHVSSIPRAILDMVKNPIFLTITLSWIFGAYIIGGYSTFLPKYLETQFYQPTHTANIYGGLVAIIGAASAAAVGGKVLSIFNPKPASSMVLVSVTGFITMVNYLLLMLIACPDKTIRGLSPNLDMQYPTTSTNLVNGYSSSCLSSCVCDTNQFDPVCSDTVDYFSPCFAGCQSINTTVPHITYSSCQCTQSTTADHGYCANQCQSKMVVYLIGSFITGFVGTFFQVALFTTIIRSVPPRKKTMTFALANFFSSVFGFMPSQVLYGRVIDTACSKWSKTAQDHNSYCLIYDSSEFRQKYHLLSVVFASLSALCSTVGAFFCKKHKFYK